MTANEYIDRVLDYLPRATPMRAQIVLELRGHITERLSSGLLIDDVLRQLGDPKTLAESYLSAVPLICASFLRRVAAKAIDGLVSVSALAVVLAPVVWIARGSVWLGFGVIFAILSASVGFGVYTIVAEFWVGDTVGKRLLGLRVVQESGAPIGLGQAVVRQLPMFLQVYWIDVLFALFTDRGQRAFELLSKTRVVQAPDQPVGLS